jgi:hypothetical protein
MAKTSAIEKNKRRMKLSEQYAAKRAALKAIAGDRSGTGLRRPDPGHGEVELVRGPRRWR